MKSRINTTYLSYDISKFYYFLEEKKKENGLIAMDNNARIPFELAQPL